MVEFKIVEVSHRDCSALNAAAKEGFGFVEWLPLSGHPTLCALVARDEERDEQREDLRELGNALIGFARDYLEQMQKNGTSDLLKRVFGEQQSAEDVPPPSPEAAPAPAP